MIRRIAALLALLATPALAQKPWETQVDLPLTVPVELPAVPPTNPFAATVRSLATPSLTPMREKFSATFPVLLAAYVDKLGICREVAFLSIALPVAGLREELQQSLLETSFTPGRTLGETRPTWLAIEVDLVGRIKEGRVAGLKPAAPDPAVPPIPEAVPSPAVDARALSLPATPVEQLDQVPSPKRFRASVPSATLTHKVHLLLEVSGDGRCLRVVFLSCPSGLRDWILSSLAGWSFRPALGDAGPLGAWVELEGEVEAELSSLSADSLKVMRVSLFPRPAAGPAGGPPPGA